MARTIVKQTTTNAWDAGAASTVTQAGDALATFTVPAGATGVLCGLAPSTVTTGAYSAVEYGTLFSAGEFIKIVELGIVVATSPVASSTGASIVIRRIGTTVTYYLPGWKYTSATSSTGTKSLDAVLYSFSDLVDDPVFAATKSLGVSSSWSWASPSVPARMQSRGRYEWAGVARMYSDGDSTFSKLTVTDRYEGSSSNMVLYEPIAITDLYTAERQIIGSIADFLTLSDLTSGSLAFQALLQDFLLVSSGVNASMVLSAMLSSTVGVSDSTSTYAKELVQYATNLQSGAVGRYQGFDFRGFCRVGLETYAFKRGGLYKVGGQTDAGALISAIIDFASEDFGSPQGKRVGNVFLGLDTDGQVYVRTTEDNDTERTYRAYQRKAEFRADMQRGVSSRFWRLRLEIIDASHASLDNIEWVVSATGRRSSR